MNTKNYNFVKYTDVLEGKEEAIPVCFHQLGFDHIASMSEVKHAYRQLVKLNHPDFGGSPQQFIALQQAYSQALSLSRKRRR